MKRLKHILSLLLIAILVLIPVFVMAEEAPAEDITIAEEAEWLEEDGDDLIPPTDPPTQPTNPAQPSEPPTQPSPPPVQPTEPAEPPVQPTTPPEPQPPTPMPPASPDPDVVRTLNITNAPGRLAAGKSRYLQVRMINSYGDSVQRDVAWVSSNSRVLTVSPTSGVIRAKSPGKARITAKTLSPFGVVQDSVIIEVVKTHRGFKIHSGGRVYSTYVFINRRVQPLTDAPQVSPDNRPPSYGNLWRTLRPIPYKNRSSIRILKDGYPVELALAFGQDQYGKHIDINSLKKGEDILISIPYTYMDGDVEVHATSYFKLRQQ